MASHTVHKPSPRRKICLPWRAIAVKPLFLQKMWFFPIFTYNLHATCYKHVLYCKIDYMGAEFGINSCSIINST
jgi:hypothetical protein